MNVAKDGLLGTAAMGTSRASAINLGSQAGERRLIRTVHGKGTFVA